VQIVQLRGTGLRECGGEKISLLLVVALDRDAVAWLDDGFEQLGRTVGRAELSARAADPCGPRRPGGGDRLPVVTCLAC
jgi:hypothetical protein